ncbi:hypothetical protein P7K49_002089 [Saguinus oedipus]|uniref:Notch NODP domain-containing protein n=1 Tax=Saguinus oedipus TaxID=9490 RepID=A0ABQ9WGB5_SAGOE|nr:hypothetical protein P7K49_002089 [Saguinus oedipus]
MASAWFGLERRQVEVLEGPYRQRRSWWGRGSHGRRTQVGQLECKGHPQGSRPHLLHLGQLDPGARSVVPLMCLTLFCCLGATLEVRSIISQAGWDPAHGNPALGSRSPAGEQGSPLAPFTAQPTTAAPAPHRTSALPSGPGDGSWERTGLLAHSLSRDEECVCGTNGSQRGWQGGAGRACWQLSGMSCDQHWPDSRGCRTVVPSRVAAVRPGFPLPWAALRCPDCCIMGRRIPGASSWAGGQGRRKPRVPSPARSIVYLEIDNRQCVQASSQCFQSATDVAAFLGALASLGSLNIPYKIEAVQSNMAWDRLRLQGMRPPSPCPKHAGSLCQLPPMGVRVTVRDGVVLFWNFLNGTPPQPVAVTAAGEATRERAHPRESGGLLLSPPLPPDYSLLGERVRRHLAAEPVRCPPADSLLRSRHLMSGRLPPSPVSAGETVEPPPPAQLHFMYVAAAAFVLLFFVGCGVLLSRKRRRQHGQLWFPEGFKVSEASKKKRREPLGEDSVGLK